jgi:hypothetical protein
MSPLPSSTEDNERPPNSPVWTTLNFVGPAAILAILLVTVAFFGSGRLRTWLPVDALFNVIFYLIPAAYVYTLVLLHFHKRKYSVNFWMTELMLALIPLALLGAFFAYGLCVRDLDRAL